MTKGDWVSIMMGRATVLASLEYRLLAARARKVRVTGWVLTQAEAETLCLWPGALVWCAGQRLPVKRIIPKR